jgi:hypothetical protein
VSRESLKLKIDFEIKAIEHELSDTRALFEKLGARAPDGIEIRALASTLHTFYCGVENILAAISRQVDGTVPDDDRWHQSLLIAMSRPTAIRGAVLSEEIKWSLKKYLAFRHFYRHSYGHYLDWEQMKPLCIANESLECR